MPQNIDTAVIAAAGLATRMWPASKVVPKELFPLGKVPAVVHLVWELMDAGIRRVILVVSEHASGATKALFDRSISPPPKVAHDPVVQRFQAMLSGIELTFLHQRGNYGNGTPLVVAAQTVGAQPCIYAFGDDIVLGENVSAGLIETFGRTGCPVLAAQVVEPWRKPSFGILECREENGAQYVSRLVEKPNTNETPSNLASLGRYLVTPDLKDLLCTVCPGRDGEVWFVDAVIQHMKKDRPVCAFTLTTGKWYTVGDEHSYVEAVSAATTN